MFNKEWLQKSIRDEGLKNCCCLFICICRVRVNRNKLVVLYHVITTKKTPSFQVQTIMLTEGEILLPILANKSYFVVLKHVNRQ